MLAGEKIKLIDFGAATEYEDEKSLEIILKHGYAPIEQYSRHGTQGTWTDVYALCATMYCCITGVVPPDASDRAFSDELLLSPSQMKIQTDPVFEKVLMHGLALAKEERIQDIDELFAELEKVPTLDLGDALSTKPKKGLLTPEQMKELEARVNRERLTYIMEYPEKLEQEEHEKTFSLSGDDLQVPPIPKRSNSPSETPPQEKTVAASTSTGKESPPKTPPQEKTVAASTYVKTETKKKSPLIVMIVLFILVAIAIVVKVAVDNLHNQSDDSLNISEDSFSRNVGTHFLEAEDASVNLKGGFKLQDGVFIGNPNLLGKSFEKVKDILNLSDEYELGISDWWMDDMLVTYIENIYLSDYEGEKEYFTLGLYFLDDSLAIIEFEYPSEFDYQIVDSAQKQFGNALYTGEEYYQFYLNAKDCDFIIRNDIYDDQNHMCQIYTILDMLPSDARLTDW